MRTMIQLPEELHAKLRHYAVDARISMAEVIRRAAESYLNRSLARSIKPKLVSIVPRLQVDESPK